MSHTFKRNFGKAYDRESGRIPVIHKTPDYEVSHSKDCYLCCSGTRPKRLFQSKPDRRKNKQELLFELRMEGLA